MSYPAGAQDNPILLDDDDDEVQWIGTYPRNPSRAPTTAYVEVLGHGRFAELAPATPATILGSVRRQERRGRQRQSNSIRNPASPSTQDVTSSRNDSRRSLSIREDQQAPMIALSNNESAPDQNSNAHGSDHESEPGIACEANADATRHVSAVARQSDSVPGPEPGESAINRHTRPIVIGKETQSDGLSATRSGGHSDSISSSSTPALFNYSPSRNTASCSDRDNTPHANEVSSRGSDLPINRSRISTPDASTAALLSASSEQEYPDIARRPAQTMHTRAMEQRNTGASNSHNEPISPIPFYTTSSNVDTLRTEIDLRLSRHLQGRYEDHAYMTKNALRRQRTCFDREQRRRIQQGNDNQCTSPVLPEKYIQHQSPFSSLSTIQTPFDPKNEELQRRNLSQEISKKSNSKPPTGTTVWSVPATAQTFPATPFPRFTEYVPLRTSILADNVSKLNTTPYVEEEAKDEELRKDLPELYEIRHDTNSLLDLRNEQSRFYMQIVTAFLTEISVSWDVILFWLLASKSDIERVNQGMSDHKAFRRVLLDRSVHAKETFVRAGSERKTLLFHRNAKHSQGLLEELKEPTAEQLRVASLACAALRIQCGFSVWYLAKESKAMRSYVESKLSAVKYATDLNFQTIACRVCHQHDCIFHGQMREDAEFQANGIPIDPVSTTSTPLDGIQTNTEARKPSTKRKTAKGTKSDESEESSADESVGLPAHVFGPDYDIQECVINYKTPLNPFAFADRTYPSTGNSKVPPEGPFDKNFWFEKTTTWKHDVRGPFFPCNHEGACIDAKCRCYREGITCEKTCRCDATCNRRFPGCKCFSVTGRRSRPCRSERLCLCVKFKRECDADLCGTCGAHDILDPVNRYNDPIMQGRCSNVGIQRGVPKKTLLGQSELHGFGLYAGQNIPAKEIIGEYTGEIINHGEEIRRGHIYYYQKTMYHFRANKDQDIDGTYWSNKLRFINNADPKFANCGAKTLFCNGVFRIALFAEVSVKAGQELFFFYNYPPEVTKNFKQPKRLLYAAKHRVKPTTQRRRTHRTAPSTTGVQTPDGSIVHGISKNLIDLQMEDDSHASEATGEPEDDGMHAGESDNTQDTQESFVISATDEEDDDFELQTQEQAEEIDDDAEEEVGPRTRRTRPRAVKSASVVAVREQRRRVRPRGARKRTRSAAFSSEDENLSLAMF